MGRTTAFLLAIAAGCICLTGCSHETAQPPAESSTAAAESTAQTQESTTETKKPSKQPKTDLTAAERAAQFAEKGDAHVSDETGTLTNDALKTLNQTAAEIADHAAIEIAAVITDHLGEMSPDEFAAEYYNTLYGRDSSGFLVLVNNDTGEDRVYTSGACRHYLAQEDIALTIAQATPQLVTGDYAPALDKLIGLGALMPDTIYDHSGILSREQYEGFLSLAEDAMEGSKKQYSVLLVDTRTWQAENSLQSYTDAQCGELKADVLLVIDVQDKLCAVSGDVPDAAAMASEIGGVLQDAASLPVTAAVTSYYEKVKALH